MGRPRLNGHKDILTLSNTLNYCLEDKNSLSEFTITLVNKSVDYYLKNVRLKQSQLDILNEWLNK